MTKKLPEWPSNLFVAAVVSFFVIGARIGYEFHPYQSCKRMYETPEDISECVWIKENP